MTKPSMNPLEADTKLFQLVQNWFQQRPDTLIPLDAWERKLKAYGISEDTEFVVTTGTHHIQFYAHSLIPALASISLGLGRDHLAKTMHHHGCAFSDMSALISLELRESEQKPLSEKHSRLDIDSIKQAMVGAMVTLPEHFDSLLENWHGLRKYCEMDFLRSNDSEFWPNTRLDEFAESFEKYGKGDVVSAQQTPNNLFLLGSKSADNRSHEEIRQLIYRAGYLNPKASFDNGCPNDFFYQVLVRAADKVDQDAVDIVAAINSVTDESERSAFAKAIIGSLSCRPANAPSGDVDAARILPLLDAIKYADVINSPVLRLSLLEAPISQDKQSSPFHTVNETTLFSELNAELMAVEPTSLKYLHFRSLMLFAKNWPNAQCPDGVDVNGLIVHVMKGFESYLATPRWVGQGMTKMGNTSAKDKVEAFLEMASKIAVPDYDRLNELTSSSKGMLCANGYNIRHFKGMTHQDKGKVLCDDLGM